jgi:uncharacterized protein (DUF885 family)
MIPRNSPLRMVLAWWLLSQLPVSTRAIAADPQFDKIVDDYFESRFAFRPSEGTAAGLHQYDEKLEDLSRERIIHRVDELVRFQERLTERKRQHESGTSRLSVDDAIDLEFLLGQVTAERIDLDTLRVWEHNPMIYAMLAGNAVDLLMKRDFAPSVDRLRALTARESAIPAIFEAAKRNLKKPPREFTDLAIRMTKGSVTFFERSVAAWGRQAIDEHRAEFVAFMLANKRAVFAIEEFAKWLETDLKPRSTGRYAIGKDLFLAKLKAEEQVDIPLDQLLARGEANLEKDYRAFLETTRRIDPNKTPAEVMKSLSDVHPTADDLIPTVRRSIEASRQFLIDKKIVTIPSDVRPRIEETPPYARSGSFASMDTPGPYETKATEAFYYVTPVEKDWDARHVEEHLRLFNPPVVTMINVHEAYPGHFLQFLYVKRFPTKVRKLLACATNAEGWAHYCEQMMVDEGFGGGDPRIRLAQLQEALLRDCRYVVGIKLHTEGWTVEQGARLFVDKGFQEPANGYEEARRGTYNPTYLYYTYGKLEIQKLRDDFLAKKGGTLRDFHDAFVVQGGLPLPSMRQLLLRE